MFPKVSPIVFALTFLACAAAAQSGAAADPIKKSLDEGDSAFSEGDYDAARTSFEQAWRMAAGLPPDAPARYDILKRLVTASAATGRFEDAAHYLDEALHVRKATGDTNDPKLMGDLALSITLDLRTKNFEGALATAERVRAIHEASYTAESLQVADDLMRIGQIYQAAGQAKEAARAFASSAQLRTKLAGSLDPGLLPTFDGLAESFRIIAGGRAAGNETIYRRALTIRETLYGRDSSQLISTLEDLADAYAAAGDFASAEPVYERLLSVWEAVVGKDHPMVAVTLDKLVVFYFKADKPEKARAALARSVAIRTRFLATGLSQEAADQLSQGRNDRAQALYERALAALDPADSGNQDLISVIRSALAKVQKTAK